MWTILLTSVRVLEFFLISSCKLKKVFHIVDKKCSFLSRTCTFWQDISANSLSFHQKKTLDVTRDFKSSLKLKRCACCMRVTWWNFFKCLLGTCRLLGWPSVHSQCSGLLQTFKLLGKAVDGNSGPTTPTFSKSMWWWQFWTWHTSLEFWSNAKTAFVVLRNRAFSVIFRSGHSTQRLHLLILIL